MNIWNMDTKPYEESFSLLQKGGAEYPLNFWSLNMDLPLKRALRKPKPFLGQLLLSEEGGLLVLGI